jgi:hypothetical protein
VAAEWWERANAGARRLGDGDSLRRLFEDWARKREPEKVWRDHIALCGASDYQNGM